MLVERDAALVAAGDGHGVVEGNARADVWPLEERLGQRIEERHRAGEVRRQLRQEQPAFLQRLFDQPEVQHLQVPEPAVDELGGAGRGARRPVVGLHDADAQPPRDSVERRAAADDSAADDEDVELLAGCVVALSASSEAPRPGPQGSLDRANRRRNWS